MKRNLIIFLLILACAILMSVSCLDECWEGYESYEHFHTYMSYPWNHQMPLDEPIHLWADFELKGKYQSVRVDWSTVNGTIEPLYESGFSADYYPKYLSSWDSIHATLSADNRIFTSWFKIEIFWTDSSYYLDYTPFPIR